jgi:uncharacterized membrane protein YidH (DUF202 family)
MHDEVNYIVIIIIVIYSIHLKTLRYMTSPTQYLRDNPRRLLAIISLVGPILYVTNFHGCYAVIFSQNTSIKAID